MLFYEPLGNKDTAHVLWQQSHQLYFCHIQTTQKEKEGYF